MVYLAPQRHTRTGVKCSSSIVIVQLTVRRMRHQNLVISAPMGEHNVNCPDATALQCIVYQVVEHETFKWFLVSHLELRSGGAYRRYFSHHQTGDYDDFD